MNGNILTEQFDEEDTDESSNVSENQHTSYMEEHTANTNNETTNKMGNMNDDNTITSLETEDIGGNNTNVNDDQSGLYNDENGNEGDSSGNESDEHTEDPYEE